MSEIGEANHGSAWPEQNAVWEWLEKNGVYVNRDAERELIEAVTAERLRLQADLELYKAEMSEAKEAGFYNAQDLYSSYKGIKAELEHYKKCYESAKEELEGIDRLVNELEQVQKLANVTSGMLNSAEKELEHEKYCRQKLQEEQRQTYLKYKQAQRDIERKDEALESVINSLDHVAQGASIISVAQWAENTIGSCLLKEALSLQEPSE